MSNWEKARWSVGEVSALTRVSVRTLHHYDALGLLCPAGRTESGYRQYTPPDLARLWRILAYRELGLGLPQIAELLAGGPDAEHAILTAQAAALQAQLARTQQQLDALTRLMQGGDMQHDHITTLFDGFNPAEYEAETQQRWGETDAYRQSQERTRRYGKAEWAQIKAEGDALNAEAAALLDRGLAPESAEAQALAAAHRDYFSRWFYDPTPELMAGLAELWLADERFTRNLDRHRPGLAAFLSAVVGHWAREQMGRS
ncbi:MerR family transcriptional regulator [Deinococcus lacus]|uniref:MerR family transcriptional regulator n=1 Tax=Deinococcus lacus TaxID=392561 RepID=A0ABW1Y9K7_9DEIO